MSAAATAAGYLYASGRLRGRAAREQEQQHQQHQQHQAREPERKPARKEVRVAVLPEREEAPAQQPKKAPKIEYRRRRWAPE